MVPCDGLAFNNCEQDKALTDDELMNEWKLSNIHVKYLFLEFGEYWLILSKVSDVSKLLGLC